MIRFLAKTLVVIAVIFSCISFVNYLQTGQFWVPAVSRTAPSWLPFVDSTPSLQSLRSPEETIYKWREQGQWVYGPTPPEGVSAELVSEEK